MIVNNAKCFGCNQSLVKEGNNQTLLMIEKCSHFFHEKCLHEKILNSLDQVDTRGGQSKAHTGRCFASDCEHQFTYHLKRISTSQGRSYEVINLGDVSKANSGMIQKLFQNRRASGVSATTQTEKSDLLDQEVSKKSLKKALMIVACVVTATLAAILFHSILAVGAAIAGTVALGVIINKAIEVMPKLLHGLNERLNTSARLGTV